MKFDDEPAPGENLPILPGHTSPGRFERVLRAGQFAITAEIAPPDSADPEDVYARAALFDGYVDAINATDSSGANCHMSSMGICSLLTRRGYAMILCESGDGVQSGDHPDAKPVFDMDSISALGMVRHMRDEQQFLSGRAISSPPRLFLGGAANPFAPPLDIRPHRMAKKIAAGAQFIQTQYCFDVELMKTFMAQVRDMGLLENASLLAGVGPLASAKAAEWIRKNVAGVHIPDDVIKRLAGAENQKQEGVDLCVDLIEQVREIGGVSGVHIMAYRMEDRIGEIVTRSNALGGREPWRPAA